MAQIQSGARVSPYTAVMPAHHFLKSFVNAGRLSLGHRLAIIVLVLLGESLAHTFVFQSIPYAGGGDARGFVQTGLHSLFRFMVAYAVFVSVFARADTQGRAFDALKFSDASLSPTWAVVHIVAIGLVAWLSLRMHGAVTAADYWVLASIWLVCGVGAVAALFMSLGSARGWWAVLRSFRFVLLGAVPPALASVLAIQFSQSLWKPAAKITFLLVDSELRSLLPGLHSDADTQILGTDRFRVFITDACSGMEGLGLTLIFSCLILWLYRRDLRFPRALVLLPAALTLIFFLNSFRIAALVLIGNAGYPEVASVGFHSQAGWILFNLVAVSVAAAATRSRWLSAAPANHTPEIASGIDIENPVAPYLMPLVVSLAAGMLSKSLSTGFDLFYPARLIAAGMALWAYRKQLGRMDWRFSWRAIAVGAFVFVLWIMFDRILNPRNDMAEALTRLPTSVRILWIVGRAVTATATVPIVEELAFRGYLLRVLTSKSFDSIRFRDVRWPSLAASSALFGMIHGPMWLPGTLAGLAYGWLAIRRDHFGEAVAAHATTNALLVVAVLAFDNWQLW